MKFINILSLIKDIFSRIKKDEVTAVGAEITYYLILSFFPFLIFLITIASYSPVTQDEVLINLSNVLPYESYKMVIGIINEVLKSRSTSLLSIGMIATLWTSSQGAKSIIKGINKAYNEREDRSYFKLKGMGMLFTIALAIAILFAFIAIVFGKLLTEELFGFLGIPVMYQILWSVLRYALPLGGLFIVFASIYRFAPNFKLSYKEVYAGAIFSTFGWIFISMAFSYYVNNFNSFSRTYGSIGGIIILLIWLYLSSIIILIGGEINASIYFSNKNTNSNINIEKKDTSYY
ncbi:YihY/virulence factor BrkB family protein [Sporosalibacterium faouarense]|uniref:YihY/virulence factor BrkB family protein n=1 Tax=Sporosalibacterium faouarense TaxID=516123 RepID=UPI00192BF7AB|nr:YihY/virulence factor BrkB family protein [Sporosalibacterium faouarense]